MLGRAGGKMKVDYNHVFTARLRDYPVWFLFLSPWAVEAVLYNSAIRILSHNFDLVFVCFYRPLFLFLSFVGGYVYISSYLLSPLFAQFFWIIFSEFSSTFYFSFVNVRYKVFL